MTADLILARDAIKMLFKVCMIKEARKKTKENITNAFRTSFDRVLIENEVIRLRANEIKKVEDVMLKKMMLRLRPEYEYATSSHRIAPLRSSKACSIISVKSSINRIHRFSDHVQILSERITK
jgi:hypothetical protein